MVSLLRHLPETPWCVDEGALQQLMVAIVPTSIEDGIYLIAFLVVTSDGHVCFTLFIRFRLSDDLLLRYSGPNV